VLSAFGKPLLSLAQTLNIYSRFSVGSKQSSIEPNYVQHPFCTGIASLETRRLMMNPEYDFSNTVRGPFDRPSVIVTISVYWDGQILECFISTVCK
jgi:hypothetical protein